MADVNAGWQAKSPLKTIARHAIMFTGVQRAKVLWMKRFLFGYVVLVGAVASVFSACAPTIKVGYSLEDIEKLDSDRYMDVVVNVNKFQDKRWEFKKNKLSFKSGRIVKDNGKDVCVNSEQTYSGGGIPAQIAQQVARHIRKRGNYKGAAHGSFPHADYYLSGKLSAFHGRQDVSIQDAVGHGIGGIVGVVVSETAKTPGEVIIAFNDLVLYDQEKRKVAELPPIYGTFPEEFKADSYCWQIFYTVNKKLKIVIKKLIEKLDVAVWQAMHKQ